MRDQERPCPDRGSTAVHLLCALVNSLENLVKAISGMSELRFNEEIKRPTACPFCQGKRVDTLA